MLGDPIHNNETYPVLPAVTLALWSKLMKNTIGMGGCCDHITVGCIANSSVAPTAQFEQ